MTYIRCGVNRRGAKNLLGTPREQFEGLFEMIFVQIDVTVVHLNRVMSGRGHHCPTRYAGNRPTRDSCVSQVVQVEILDARFLARQFERSPNCTDCLPIVNKNATRKIGGPSLSPLRLYPHGESKKVKGRHEFGWTGCAARMAGSCRNPGLRPAGKQESPPCKRPYQCFGIRPFQDTRGSRRVKRTHGHQLQWSSATGGSLVVRLLRRGKKVAGSPAIGQGNTLSHFPPLFIFSRRKERDQYECRLKLLI